MFILNLGYPPGMFASERFARTAVRVIFTGRSAANSSYPFMRLFVYHLKSNIDLAATDLVALTIHLPKWTGTRLSK